MFCPNCGNQCPDGTNFCQSCGAPLTNNRQQNEQPNYGNQQNFHQQPYQQYQQPNYNQYQQPYVQPYPDPYNGHPMGWYKFLIYFALFAGAFFNLITAILYLTGNIYTSYNSDPHTVYSLFPALKPIDIIYGIVLIAVSAFMIATRFQLSGMKKNGPKMIVALYIINLAFSIIYTVAISFVINSMEFNVTIIGQCIVPIVMAIVNKVYFDRRKDLFVK